LFKVEGSQGGRVSREREREREKERERERERENERDRERKRERGRVSRTEHILLKHTTNLLPSGHHAHATT
jgi:hypothetical protein